MTNQPHTYAALLGATQRLSRNDADALGYATITETEFEAQRADEELLAQLRREGLL